MLQLPKAGTDKFAARTGAGIDGNQIVGLYLNIRYDNGEMYCITGTSLNFFTMDKTLDLEWDKAVKQFYSPMRFHVQRQLKDKSRKKIVCKRIKILKAYKCPLESFVYLPFQAQKDPERT